VPPVDASFAGLRNALLLTLLEVLLLLLLLLLPGAAGSVCCADSFAVAAVEALRCLALLTALVGTAVAVLIPAGSSTCCC
jgi:hypothetical protein